MRMTIARRMVQKLCRPNQIIPLEYWRRNHNELYGVPYVHEGVARDVSSARVPKKSLLILVRIVIQEGFEQHVSRHIAAHSGNILTLAMVCIASSENIVPITLSQM